MFGPGGEQRQADRAVGQVAGGIGDEGGFFDEAAGGGQGREVGGHLARGLGRCARAARAMRRDQDMGVVKRPALRCGGLFQQAAAQCGQAGIAAEGRQNAGGGRARKLQAAGQFAAREPARRHEHRIDQPRVTGHVQRAGHRQSRALHGDPRQVCGDAAGQILCRGLLRAGIAGLAMRDDQGFRHGKPRRRVRECRIPSARSCGPVPTSCGRSFRRCAATRQGRGLRRRGPDTSG